MMSRLDDDLGSCEPSVNFWWGQGRKVFNQPNSSLHDCDFLKPKPSFVVWEIKSIPKKPWPICHTQWTWEKFPGQNGQDLVHACYDVLWGFGWGPWPLRWQSCQQQALDVQLHWNSAIEVIEVKSPKFWCRAISVEVACLAFDSRFRFVVFSFSAIALQLLSKISHCSSASLEDQYLGVCSPEISIWWMRPAPQSPTNRNLDFWVVLGESKHTRLSWLSSHQCKLIQTAVSSFMMIKKHNVFFCWMPGWV